MVTIAGLSDVTLGFGSTQVPTFMKFLSNHYLSDPTVIIEPDQTDIPIRDESFGKIRILRVPTFSHIYSKTGRIEYVVKACKIINDLKPDILVVFTTFCLPVLFKLSFRPKFVIYYSLESVSAYWDLDIQMNSQISSLVDLIIFPEENRAVRFLELCGVNGIPMCIVYNCINSNCIDNIVPTSERNGRMIHQGRLKDDTGLDFFMNEKIQSFPIDLYGIVDALEKEKSMELLTNLLGNVQYKGSVNHDELAIIRKYYSYSIVYWKPTSENTFYACPNKFFESIADGIVPISTPHPQCKMLIKRYNCGLVIDDWSFDSFYETLDEAIRLYDTDRYLQMVENCKKAVIRELNWPKQMEKVVQHLVSI